MVKIRVRGSGMLCSQVGTGLFVHVCYNNARPHKQLNDGRFRVTQNELRFSENTILCPWRMYAG